MLKVLILGSGIQAAMAAIALARSSGDKSLHWAPGGSGSRCEFQCAGPEFERFLTLLDPQVQARAAKTCLEPLTGYHFKRALAQPVDHLHTWSDYGAPFRVLPFASVFHAMNPQARAGIDHYSLAARCARQGLKPIECDDPSSIFSTVRLGFRIKTAPFVELLREYADALGVESVEVPDLGGEEAPGVNGGFDRLLTTYDRVLDCRHKTSTEMNPGGSDACCYRIDYRGDGGSSRQLREMVSLEGGLVVLDRSVAGSAASVYTRDPDRGESLLASALRLIGDRTNGFCPVNTCEVTAVSPDTQSTPRVLDLRWDERWPQIGVSQLDYQWASLRSALDVMFLAPNPELARIHDRRRARYARDYARVLALVDRLFARELSVCVSSAIVQKVADELDAYDRTGIWQHDTSPEIVTHLDCLLAGLGREPDHLNVKCAFYPQKEFAEFAQLIDRAIRKALSQL